MERKRLRVSVCRRAGRNEYKLRLNAAAESAGSVFMSSSVIFLVLVMCQPSRLSAQTLWPQTNRTEAQLAFLASVAQHTWGARYQESSTPEARLEELTVAPKKVVQGPKTASNNVGVPKPAVGPTAGTWKYRETDVLPRTVKHHNDHSTFTITIKDDGGVWTITTAMKFPDGPVTDVSTLEKGTLILRKESFKHFLHPDQPWKPVAISLDFTGNKVTGIMKYVSRPDKAIAVELGGPAFADSASSDVTIGCLPLADGYSTTFRYFDIERLALNPQAPDKEKLMQLYVVGMERVTVPAGTFDSYKVELTSAEGGSHKHTVWIDKDSRTPVKAYEVEVVRGDTYSTTTELVP
jgi:hypothetical protein